MKALRCLGMAVVSGVVASLLAIVLMAGCGSSQSGYNTKLVVVSTPVEGAQVSINGEPVGETPLTLEGIEPGKVYVQVAKEGYTESDATVTMPEEGEERIELRMRKLVGRVTFDSIPKGAKVVLDGNQTLGVTPLEKCEVAVGTHQYMMILDNYEPFTKTISVQRAFEYQERQQLKPKPGEIEVTANRGGAQIFVNSRDTQKYAPAKILVPPGAYTVSVRVKGYMVAEQGVTLGPNEKRKVSFDLSAGEGPPGMVLVPAGEFICGSNNAAPDEQPRRKMDLPAFFIDKFEVTNRQFKEVFPSHAYPNGQDDFPVSGVSHQQAESYASKVGKRLPTEFEWEKAARGTDGRSYPWGNSFDPNACNFSGTKPNQLREISQFPGGVSPYGCVDMAGNVMEWTSSWYQAYPGNTGVKAEYGQRYKVLRGGCFTSGTFDLRCCSRSFAGLQEGRAGFGFRCAMDADKAGRLE